MAKQLNKSMLILLAAVIACSASCGEGAIDSNTDIVDTVSDAGTSETVEETVNDDVPELDFGGYEFRIGTPDNSHYNGDLCVDEINGDVYNDALFDRRRYVENRFNITITEDVYGNGQANVLRDYIIKETAAGDCTYDFTMMTERYALTLALQNSIYDINSIKYIDPEKPYWTRQINDEMRIGDRLYFMFGDISTTTLDFTHLIAFNKRIIDEYSLEDPYELVKSGEWTWDKFCSMAKVVANDTNSNGVQDDTDMYGFVSPPKQILPNFWISAGERSIKKDNEGYPYFSLPGDQKFAELFERIFNIVWDSNIWYMNKNDSNIYYETLKHFQEGYALFASHTLYSVGKLRDMKDDFGVLPYPKYDESQIEYYSRVEAGAQVCVVPITNGKPDMAGAVIEAMASYAYNEVIPAYYEVTIKDKYSRDDDSAEMFDLIVATRAFDLGDTFWCEVLRDGIFAKMFANNDRTLASTMEKNRTKIESSINNVNEFFKSLN